MEQAHNGTLHKLTLQGPQLDMKMSRWILTAALYTAPMHCQCSSETERSSSRRNSQARRGEKRRDTLPNQTRGTTTQKRHKRRVGISSPIIFLQPVQYQKAMHDSKKQFRLLSATRTILIFYSSRQELGLANLSENVFVNSYG